MLAPAVRPLKEARTRFLVAAATLATASPALAQEGLNDLEMAHVAVTANHSDIAYAHLALAFSESPAVRRFAETMIRDHSAVNEQVAALAKKLGAEAKDNDFSRQLARNGRGPPGRHRPGLGLRPHRHGEDVHPGGLGATRTGSSEDHPRRRARRHDPLPLPYHPTMTATLVVRPHGEDDRARAPHAARPREGRR